MLGFFSSCHESMSCLGNSWIIHLSLTSFFVVLLKKYCRLYSQRSQAHYKFLFIESANIFVVTVLLTSKHFLYNSNSAQHRLSKNKSLTYKAYIYIVQNMNECTFWYSLMLTRLKENMWSFAPTYSRPRSSSKRKVW